MKKLIFSLLIAALMTIVPRLCVAHGDGLTYEVVVNGYLVDIGFDEAVAGEPAAFDLGLFSGQGGQRVDFDYAWVRIEQAGETRFAGPVSSMDFGKPGFVLTLSDAGEHDASVEFMDEGKTLAKVNFKVPVAGSQAKGAGALVIAAIAVPAAFFAGRLLKRHA